ncbi:putative bifunctional diguanylate cyclase/phosphodiesterase [Desulfovibrio ferrophilus]|uniref:Diguanylate cyclase/phosphodiesterase with PAS/PAC sensor(S) n=1 Tax=Desulfovibrio ferrophilus TaxID=241368 RepID=A0A2Z6AZR7_9BACT|nr:EAL domain-containing protein [Desulfovibrio ferrophilus]BBD08646.1 diguanylate cyclase/phosphodiesterase with PAS/PAC sensor(S) [Desulfovibrio ferrophilus]
MPAFRSLNISTKLLLSALAFVLPVAMLSVFMDLSFRYDIRIAETELAGITHLRSSAPLMRLSAEHQYMRTVADHGSLDAQARLSAIEADIDTLLDAIDARHIEFVKAIDNAPEGVASVFQDKLTPADLRRSWAKAKDGDAGASERFQNTIRQFFRGVADCSQLAVDPALDSAYLVDAIVFAVPESLAHQHETKQTVFKHLMGEKTMDSSLQATIDTHIVRHENDMQFILGGGQSALMMDDYFYGRSPGLQTRFKAILDQYHGNTTELIRLLRDFHSNGSMSPGFDAVCDAALSDLDELFTIGLDELQALIEKRLTSYRTWRAMGYGFSALALLLAAILLLRTYLSVTGSINKVRRYSADVRAGDYNAEVEGYLGGEMQELADGISQMVNELKHKLGYLDGILNGLTVPCLVVDTEERLTFINQHYLDLYEREGTPDDYLGLTVGEFYYGDSERNTLTGRALRENRTFRIDEVEGETNKGNPLFVRYDVAPIHDLDGNLTGAFSVITDLTRLKQQQSQILFDATHDKLTGLPNRVLFADRIRRTATHAAKTEDHGYAVLLLDVDNFKHVNDSLGHGFGDLLITNIAGRLNTLIRSCDVLARLGGDEFALLLDPVSGPDEALELAGRVHSKFAAPFIINGHEIFATTGIGIVVDTDDTRSPDDILRDADTAMYRAKDKGTGRSQLFDQSMHDAAREHLELETDMKRGVERDEFVPYYQPIIDLKSGQISGFEALVRWNHPTKGLVPPGRFIPLAEQNGQVVPMGKRMLEQALTQATVWQREIPGYEKLTMSVNLAVPQLMRPDMPQVVAKILADTGMSPAQVKLEITESGLMGNAQQALEAQRKLKALGVSLSIDDFGTGYSSLSYLSRFPFDFLKVDQSFVFVMQDNEENMEIVRSIVSLAHSLGKKIIAEGVETPEQLALLRNLGCEYGQGYLFAKPLPTEKARSLLEKNPTW